MTPFFILLQVCAIALTSSSEAENVKLTITELDALRDGCSEKKNRLTHMSWKSFGDLPTIDHCELDDSASDGHAVLFDVRFGPFELKPGMIGGTMLQQHGQIPFPPDLIHPDGLVRVSAQGTRVEYLNGTLAPYPPIHVHHIVQHNTGHEFTATDSRCNPIEEDEDDSCTWWIMEAGYSTLMPLKQLAIALEHLGENGSVPAMKFAVRISIRLIKPTTKMWEQKPVDTFTFQIIQDGMLIKTHENSYGIERNDGFNQTTLLPEGTSIVFGKMQFPHAVRIVPYTIWHSHHYSNGGFVFLGDIRRKGIENLLKIRYSEDVARLMNDTTTAADVRLLCEYGHNSPGSPDRGDFKALPNSNCALNSVFDLGASEIITTLCVNHVSLKDNPPVAQHCIFFSNYVHLPISKKK